MFLTQKDKTDIIERIDGVKLELEVVKAELNSTLYKTVYTVGVIQLLAIIGSVLAIINYIHK